MYTCMYVSMLNNLKGAENEPKNAQSSEFASTIISQLPLLIPPAVAVDIKSCKFSLVVVSRVSCELSYDCGHQHT